MGTPLADFLNSRPSRRICTGGSSRLIGARAAPLAVPAGLYATSG